MIFEQQSFVTTESTTMSADTDYEDAELLKSHRIPLARTPIGLM